MFELKSTFVTKSHMLNKLAEKAGLDEKCEAEPEVNLERKILFEKLNKYSQPLQTKSEHSSYTIKQLNRLVDLANKEKIYCTKHNIPYHDRSYILKHYEKNLCKVDTNITYGLDVVSLEYNIVLPYQSEVRLEEFEECLEYVPSLTPNQKRISMISSIPAILDLAEKKGFTLDNLSTLLTLVIKKFIPSSEALVKSVTSRHPGEFLNIITNNMNITKNLEEIDKLIDQITRTVNETIYEVVEKCRSLQIHRLRLVNPKLDREEMDRRANRAIIVHLQYWVTKPTWEKVLIWRKQIERTGLDLHLEQYLEKIIEFEAREKYRPTTTMKSSSNMDYPTLASIANVEEEYEDYQEEAGSVDDGYGDEMDDQDQEQDVNYVQNRSGYKGGRGRGRSNGRGNQRSSSTPTQRSSRQSRPQQRRNHPRQRSYSRTYTRTNSYPRKSIFRSPGGTYRNRSTNSSHGRSPSLASSNSSTSSSQRREYLSNSLTSSITEDTNKCLRCYGRHLSSACPRFRQYSKSICDYCYKKRKLSLYHSSDLCPFKAQVGRATNYVEPSPGTLQRRYERRISTQNKNNNKNRRYRSPANDFVKTQYNSGLHSKALNSTRGKR